MRFAEIRAEDECASTAASPDGEEAVEDLVDREGAIGVKRQLAEYGGETLRLR